MRNRFGVLLSASVLLGLGCRSAPQLAPDAPPTAVAHATPDAAPTPPTPTAPEAVLPHQSFTLASRILGETRRINVYTPPGYDAAPDKRYPVLYMPDGGLAEDFPHVTRDVDTAIRAGQMRPLIVVGIENTKRRRDMTGPTQMASDKEIAPVVGGSAAFRAFLRDELVPEIAKRVRGSGETAIVGESLAGLFVLETFFEEPSLFDTYIALSPSLWWNDQALVHAAAARLEANPSIEARLYFATAGDDQQEQAAELLVRALRAKAPVGLGWSYTAWPRLKHSTIYRGASPAVFRKLFPPRGVSAGASSR
jgi:predicted alpha/beta superfamily hydrolase